jgi:D-glycero-beta-D-manno-heptose-7-phosphate kinase
MNKLDDLKGKKIVIFGDVGIDEYVQGDVLRISPEAPVPVVEVTNSEQKLGLSANVAANVKSLGGEAYLISLVGNDETSIRLKSIMMEQGITTEFLMTDPQRSTTKKLRVMTGHHHIVRVDFENKSPMTLEFLSLHLDNIEKTIKNSDCVIIQDYAKGLVSEDACQKIIQISKKYNKKVIVDPYRSTPLSFYKGASFMTPNRDEAFELAKQIPKPKIWKDVDAIGRELMSELDSPNMVITLGSEGMKIFNENETIKLPTFAQKVFDVTGAGDTVIAAFALGVAANWDMKTSGVLANLAAGVVVGQIGAVACTIEQLKNNYQNKN